MTTNEPNNGPSTAPSAGAANQDAPPPGNYGYPPFSAEIVEADSEDSYDTQMIEDETSQFIEEADEFSPSEYPGPTEQDGNGSDLEKPIPSSGANGQSSSPTDQKNEQQKLKLATSPKRIADFNDIPRIRDLEACEPNWLIEGLIVEQGIHIFSGQPGSMKSFLALFLAGALGAGIEIFGTKATQTRVLYLDRENPPDVIQQRFSLLHIEDESNLRYWGMWTDEQPPKLDPPQSSSFADPRKLLLDWAKKYRLVIVIDSLLGFHSKEENSASEMRQITDFLKNLRFAGATIIVLHHQGKPGIEGHKSAFRGSSEIEAACDIGYLVQKTEAGEDAILTVTSFKNRLGPPIEHRLKFRLQGWAIRSIGPASEAR